ncbi:Protein of unknown function [Bacillus mycoides]|nr:Protein of unknown function [Bacillus mycoides]
MKSNQVTIY